MLKMVPGNNTVQSKQSIPMTQKDLINLGNMLTLYCIVVCVCLIISIIGLIQIFLKRLNYPFGVNETGFDQGLCGKFIANKIRSSLLSVVRLV